MLYLINIFDRDDVIFTRSNVTIGCYVALRAAEAGHNTKMTVDDLGDFSFKTTQENWYVYRNLDNMLIVLTYRCQ